jgi:hypothetical protein
MKLKKKIVLIFVSITCLIFIIIGTSLYYFFSNIEHYSAFLAQNIEAAIHRKVSIGSVKANFWEGLGIEIKQFTVKDEKGERDIFTAHNVTIGLKLFPLLMRQVVFHKIIIDSPKVTIVRDKEGNVNLLQEISTLLKKEKRNAFKTFLTPSFSISRIIIREGEIEFIDGSLHPFPLVTRMGELELKCARSTTWGKWINFFLTSTLLTGGHKSLVRIRGEMNEFPEDGDFSHLVLDARVELKDILLSHFWPYYCRYLPFELATARLDLEANLKGSLLDNLHTEGVVRMKEVNVIYPRAFPHPLTPQKVELSYQMDMNGEFLRMKEAKLRLDDCDFSGSFLLSGIKSGDLLLAAELKSNRFLWSRFRGYLPLNIMFPGLAHFWVKSMEEGWVEVESASCSGKIKDFAKIKLPEYSDLIKGRIKVSKFNLNLLEGLIPLKDLNGTVMVEKGNLLMKGFSGTLRGSDLSRTEGTITHLYSKAVLSIKTEADLKMPQMLPMLLHEKMPTRMRPILKDITAMGGDAHMDLDISGIKLNGQYVPPAFDGSLSLNRVSISHRKLTLPITNLYGGITFNDRLVMSEKIRGTLGSSTLSFKGKIQEWQEVNPHFDVSVTSDINLSELKSFPPEGLFAEIVPQGTCFLRSNFKGYLNRLRFSGDLDLTQGKYQFYEWLLKPGGVSNKLQFSGIYFNKKNEIQLDNLRYSLKSSEIKSKGKLHWKEKPGFSFSFMTKGINLAELHYIRSADLKPMGIIRGEVETRGEFGNSDSLVVRGVATCDNAGFKLKSSPKPLFTLSTAIRFNDKAIRLDSFTFHSGSSSITVKGTMNGFSSPRIHLVASSPFLALDDFNTLKKSLALEEEKKEKGKRDWLETISLEGDVSIAQGRYQDFNFSNLRTHTVMRSGILDLKSLEFMSDESRVSSDLSLDVTWKEHTLIDSNSKMEKMKVRKVLKLLSFQGDNLTGTLDCEGGLKSKFEEFKSLHRSLNGNVKLRLSQGRIYRFTILSKVLTILNVSQIFTLGFDEFITKGMPYKSITGTLLIKNGVISTEDLFLDGDQMRISAVGKINLAKDELSLTLGVQPLVTVDKILNNIPVIGKIITGKDRSLVVSYFRAKGKISDPDVKAIPLKSLAKGVSDLLEQLLGIPKQLLEVPQKILNPSQ